jgi:hypothetical protein
MREPTESEVQRVSFVLMQFVRPWGLPLNPENLDLMAYCALRYGLNFSGDWAEIQGLLADEINRDQEQHDRMREAMRESSEDEDYPTTGSGVPLA